MLREKELRELADIVGEDFFSAEEYMRKLYSHDVGALPGLVNDILKTKADAIAQPSTSVVVSNLLKYCLEHKIPVVPRGHGTSGYGGALPTKGGVMVEMTRMNETYAIDRTNMTVEVGAGIIWGRLLEQLEDEGLTVRAYPSSAPSSTVGGWVAAGGSGIGSTKYGGIEEQVVDLEVVLPDGRIVRTSSPPEDLVEDFTKENYRFFPESDRYIWTLPEVAEKHFDLTSFFIDSNGTLGVVTKVVLRVMPLHDIKPFVASFKTRDQMVWAMQSLMAKTHPFYLHFITDGFNNLLDELNMATGSTYPWVFLCAFEGPAEEIKAEEDILKKAIKDNFGVIEPEHLAEHEWEERFYPMRIKRLGPSLVPSEVYVPLKNISAFIDRTDKRFKGEKYALEGALNDKGEVAVMAWFLDDERRKIPFLMGWYRSLDFIELGIKEHGRAYSIGMWNVAHSRSFYGKSDYAGMARMKKESDPKGVMNPDKVFPGPIQLSMRFNYLILVVAAIAVPIVLWIVGLWFGVLLTAYGLTWIAVTDLTSAVYAFGLGLVIGVAVIEVVDYIPVTFVLSIGRPFLRFGRKIFH